MKDVCRITGLTERAVRFYVHNGLLTPVGEVVNGRTYLDFSEENIVELETLAALRRARFSISEIVLMKNEPGRIAETAALVCASLREQAEESGELAQLLERADIQSVSDISQLAAALKQGERDDVPMAAVLEPHFGRFDGLSPDERDTAYRDFLINTDRRAKRRRCWATVCAAAVLVVASVIITLLATGTLPGKKVPAPEATVYDQLSETLTHGEYEARYTQLRAELLSPKNGFYLADYAANGINGNSVLVYTDGERHFTLECDKLDVMECAAVEELGLPRLSVITDPETPKQRLEIIVPGEAEGEYWGLWIESGELTEDELWRTAANGVNIDCLWPGGETYLVGVTMG